MEKIIKDISDAYSSKLQTIILHKLIELKSIALERDETKLFEILSDLDLSNVEKVKQQLDNSGYELIFVQPEIKFTGGDGRLTATLYSDGMKLQVKKVIFEV